MVGECCLHIDILRPYTHRTRFRYRYHSVEERLHKQMPLTFVHASDFHLGADLRRFGDAAGWLSSAQYAALDKTLCSARDRRADFVLICGDLFDSRRPSRSVLDRTRLIFAAYPSVSVYVIPGTHDFLSEKSVFALSQPDWAPPNVTILTENSSSPFPLADKNAQLYFRANRSNKSHQSPIAQMQRIKEDGFHIGLAHGSLQTGSLAFEYESPIGIKTIEASGLDYLALGHWHRPRADKFGRTTLAYSGIPQPISYSDPEDGSIYVVTIEDTGQVEIDRIVTSTIALKRISATIYHPQEAANLLEELADPNSVVKLAFLFSDNWIEASEVEEVIEKAKARFLLVQSDMPNGLDRVRPPAPPNGPNEQLLRVFTAELDRLREADSPERAVIYEKAIEHGIKIITGEL